MIFLLADSRFDISLPLQKSSIPTCTSLLLAHDISSFTREMKATVKKQQSSQAQSGSAAFLLNQMNSLGAFQITCLLLWNPLLLIFVGSYNYQFTLL